MSRDDRVREYVNAVESLHRFDPELNRMWFRLSESERAEVRRLRTGSR